MEKKIILALDLGTTTGWAIGSGIEADGYLDGGSQRLSKRGDIPAARYLEFKKLLDNKITTYKPAHIFYEKVWRHTGVTAAHVYGGFESQLAIIADHYMIKVDSMTPTEIKKKFTGSGSATKEHVMKVVEMTEWKVKPCDDNHGDACALLFAAISRDKMNKLWNKALKKEQHNV